MWNPTVSLSLIRRRALGLDYEFAELQGAVLSLIWGTWLLFPDYPHMPERVLLAAMSHWVWSVLFLAVGSIQLAGLYSAQWPLRRGAIMAACFLWLFSGFLVGFSDWHQPTFPVLIDFAIGSGWGYLRMGIQKRKSTRLAVMAPRSAA